MSQFERVKEFIKDNGSVYTWELEQWVRENTYKPTMLGGSATRYARLLRNAGKVEHPTDENGKEDRHCYKWKDKQIKLFKGGKK